MEYLEKLAWPIVALIAFTVFILVFKSPVAALILKIRSIKKDGIETGPATGQSNPNDVQDTDLLKRIADSPLLLEQEERIRSDLTSRNLEVKGNTIEILIHHLAQSQINAYFELIYRLIFGSQIRILREANTPNGISRSATEKYFDKISIENKPFYDNISFEGYISFMFNQTLILEKNGVFFATVRGQAFLEWMVRSQISENKNF